MYSIDTWFSLLFSNKACGRSIESNGWFNCNTGKCQIGKYNKNCKFLDDEYEDDNFVMILQGLSNYLNLRDTYLLLDYMDSIELQTNYDTDLENFWTQTSKA